MTQQTHDHPDERLGILYAGGSYLLWGFVPLYWAMLIGTSPIEITLHRIFWGAVFALAITAARGHLAHIRHIMARPKVLLALATSSVLVGANWTVFIYCVSTHQLVESSLGYYLTPLVSIALGFFLLEEKVSRLRLTAIALATAAVAAQAFELGYIPWVAPALALSFGFYGYVRKRTAVDALDGLTVETLILFPFTVAVLGYFSWQGTAAFDLVHVKRDLLLIGGGPITLVPLVLFAAGARRIRMTTLGFLQYLSPTLTLLVATFLMGESFTRADTIAFVFVWAALILVAFDARVRPSALSPAPASAPDGRAS
ncbi:MAG: EamA family transporter RarD [Alphaproteobacteria bacterium]|nr:EamA family transporter RarD [Alphaproteobacteria bacterium]